MSLVLFFNLFVRPVISMLDQIVNPNAQFTAAINFHFRDHGEDQRRIFTFGADLVRRVPMKIDGLDGMNTVEIQVSQSSDYRIGDNANVECRVIAPELILPLVKLGVHFDLWDSGFFANGTITGINESSWHRFGLTSR